MAQGDIIVFDQFMLDLLDADVGHDFGAGNTSVIKCAIVDSTLTPATTTADPCWGAGGSTDLSANEVEVVGDYAAGGNVCANPASAIVAGAAQITMDDPAAWTTGNDPDAKWAILYNDSLTPKKAIAAVDLGTAFDMSTGTLSVALPDPVVSIDQAA